MIEAFIIVIVIPLSILAAFFWWFLPKFYRHIRAQSFIRARRAEWAREEYYAAFPNRRPRR